MADEERFMSKRGAMDTKERGGSPRRSEAEEFDAKATKQVDSGEMDEEDSTVLSNDEKAPPRRVSVGWGTESAATSSDEKGISGGDGSAGATLSSDSGKRGGRRARRGSDNASNFGGGDGKNKNRYFDDDGDSTDIQEIPDLEEEEREPDITTQIAEAPRNVARAVQSLKELEKDIKFALPSAAVGEPDDCWTFDSLINEVSQEMQKDVDEKEEFLKADGA